MNGKKNIESMLSISTKILYKKSKSPIIQRGSLQKVKKYTKRPKKRNFANTLRTLKGGSCFLKPPLTDVEKMGVEPTTS